MKGVSPKEDVYQGFFPRLRTKGCSANYALEGCFIQAGCSSLAPVFFPVLVVNGDWVEVG